MADTAVETSAATALEGYGGPVIVTHGNNRIVISVNSTNDMYLYYSTDGSAPTTSTQAEDGTVMAYAVWYDRWTPSDSGTTIHVWWTDDLDNEFKYATIDATAPASGWSSITTISTLTSIDPTVGANTVWGTKTRAGTLKYGYATGTVEIESFKGAPSSPTAVTNDPLEDGQDHILVFPANTADTEDIVAVYLDTSVGEISVKMGDDSDSGAWTESNNTSTSTIFNTIPSQMSAAVRHSDGKILVAYWDHGFDNDADGEDLNSIEIAPTSIATPTWTAKGLVYDTATASSESLGICGLMINQQNDDVYVAYGDSSGGGANTILVDGIIRYKKSTDDMATWGTEQSYQEDTGDDVRGLHAGVSVDAAGGAFMPVFFNDDLADVFVNTTNDVVISAAAGGANPKGVLGLPLHGPLRRVVGP